MNVCTISRRRKQCIDFFFHLVLLNLKTGHLSCHFYLVSSSHYRSLIYFKLAIMYSYIVKRVFKLFVLFVFFIASMMIWKNYSGNLATLKETRRAEHEYMNMQPPPQFRFKRRCDGPGRAKLVFNQINHHRSQVNNKLYIVIY